MYKILIFVVVLTMVELSWATNPTKTKKHLILGIGGFSPYNARVKTILERAYGKLGITIELKYYPPKRVFIEANEGAVDGLLFRVKDIDKKYENLIRLPVKLMTANYNVFAAKGINFKVAGKESMKPYRVVIKGGILAIEDFICCRKDIIRVTKVKNVLQMLMLGRAQIGLLPELIGQKLLKESKTKEVKMLQPPFLQHDLFHYLHKKNDDLIPLITKELKKMPHKKIRE